MTEFGFEKPPGSSNFRDRCACVLLLDTSGSMEGDRIRTLNRGLKTFAEALEASPNAKKQVEVAIITFGGDVPSLEQDFVQASEFEPPVLYEGGLTPMGQAIEMGLDKLRERKDYYRASGMNFYRPWLFMITDGEPQGEQESVWRAAAARIQQEEDSRGVVFFAVGVQDANMSRLSEICPRGPKKLDGLKFDELFLWLSDSLETVSRSPIDDVSPLPGRDSWEADLGR